MSVLHAKQSTETESAERIRSALVHELKKLVKLAKDRNISLVRLTNSVSRLELMVLDSAFKNVPLEKADETLLILPDKFNEMLQKLIVFMVRLLQN